jgi:hypothetical protein
MVAVIDMAIYLVDVEPGDLQAVATLVEKGRYASVEQFLAVAIRNQLAYERQVTSPRGLHERTASAETARNPTPIGGMDLQAYALGTSRTVVEGVHHSPTASLLWGQYYRFLPLKATLRLMVNGFGGEIFLLQAAHRIIRDKRLGLADCVDSKRTDGGQIRLGVGFPGRSRDLERSMERFIVQYVGRCASDGSLTGFPQEMGFLGKAGDDADCVVRLSDSGAAFAQFLNPVVDSASTREPLSAEERGFLIEHICRHMPLEAAHMGLVVRAIDAGRDSPAELLEELRGFYQDTYRNRELSDSQVTLMRSGCISRLIELGIVIPARSAGKVRYSISPDHPENVHAVLSYSDRKSGTEEGR